MIVMQYRFTLPVDYDMEIIVKRIHDNGAKFNGFPGLLFKTFLFALRNDSQLEAKENRYAPLYVWKNAQAMTQFLQSPGFRLLTQNFGWPQIDTWLALKIPAVNDVRNKSYLSINKQAITPHCDLAALDVTAQLCAWDVSRWELLNVTFGHSPQANQENYRIGYVACENY